MSHRLAKPRSEISRYHEKLLGTKHKKNIPFVLNCSVFVNFCNGLYISRQMPLACMVYLVLRRTHRWHYSSVATHDSQLLCLTQIPDQLRNTPRFDNLQVVSVTRRAHSDVTSQLTYIGPV